jgi:hypothetical protein
VPRAASQPRPRCPHSPPGSPFWPQLKETPANEDQERERALTSRRNTQPLTNPA